MHEWDPRSSQVLMSRSSYITASVSPLTNMKPLAHVLVSNGTANAAAARPKTIQTAEVNIVSVFFLNFIQ